VGCCVIEGDQLVQEDVQGKEAGQRKRSVTGNSSLIFYFGMQNCQNIPLEVTNSYINFVL
jgi:hypothetical protein